MNPSPPSLFVPNPRGQIRSIQALRALAALMVTVAHASEEAKHFFDFVPILETDAFGKGVDLFFVISGFIIYFASRVAATAPTGWAIFLRQRFIRVAPMYFLATALMVGVLLVFPAGLKEARLDWHQIVSSFFFWPYERYDGRTAPILSLGWTLNYEMFFYLVFAACLPLTGRAAKWACVIVIVALVVIGATVPADAPAALRFWTSNIMLEFAAGILIAVAYERFQGALAQPVLAFLLIAIGLVLLYVLNTPPKPLAYARAVTAGIPAAMIVLGATVFWPSALERRVPPWLVAMGDSSYALYLSHRFIQRPIQIALSSVRDQVPFVGAIYVALATAAAVLFGHWVYKRIEVPLLHLLRGAQRSGQAKRELGQLPR